MKGNFQKFVLMAVLMKPASISTKFQVHYVKPTSKYLGSIDMGGTSGPIKNTHSGIRDNFLQLYKLYYVENVKGYFLRNGPTHFLPSPSKQSKQHRKLNRHSIPKKVNTVHFFVIPFQPKVHWPHPLGHR